MANPLVTCLMPVGPTPEVWLRTAIRTAASQTYENLDLVICDDGNTEASTIGVLKEAAERWPDRVQLVRNDGRHGTAYALDVALAASDEETVYLTKVDSDDIFHPDREKNRVELFEKLPPSIGLIYDNFFQMYYYPKPHIRPIVSRPYDYRFFLEDVYIHGNSMWRASVYEKIPKTFVYDGYEGKANHHAEDYNLWLAITDHFDGFWMNCDPAFSWTYRAHTDSKYFGDRKGSDYAKAMLSHRAAHRRNLCTLTACPIRS